MGPSPDPEQLVDGLVTAVRILTAVVTAADPGDRAIIWRTGEHPTTVPPADFLPRGGLELALHAHDVSVGLQVAFDPPRVRVRPAPGAHVHLAVLDVAGLDASVDGGRSVGRPAAVVRSLTVSPRRARFAPLPNTIPTPPWIRGSSHRATVRGSSRHEASCASYSTQVACTR